MTEENSKKQFRELADNCEGDSISLGSDTYYFDETIIDSSEYGNPVIVEGKSIKGKGINKSILKRGFEPVGTKDELAQIGKMVCLVRGGKDLELRDFSIDMNCGREDDKIFSGFKNIGQAMYGLNPLDICNCSHMTVDNIRVINNTYGAIRVYGDESTDLKFRNSYFENTDCGIIFSQAKAKVDNVLIDNCYFNGHYESESISFFGRDAQYSNIRINDCVFKNKNTCAIYVGGLDIAENKDLVINGRESVNSDRVTADGLTITNCSMINCVSAFCLDNVNNFQISNVKAYMDNENLDSIVKGTGFGLWGAANGLVSNVLIDSADYAALLIEKSKDISMNNISITNVFRAEDSTSLLVNMSDSENINIDNLIIKSANVTDKSLKLSNCKNCNINIKQFIPNGKENLKVFLIGCTNCNITIPDDCGIFIYDDSIKASNNTTNYIHFANRNEIDCECGGDPAYFIANMPLCNTYFMRTGVSDKIDFSKLPLSRCGKIFDISLENTSGKDCTLNFAGGTIKNAKESSVIFKAGEVYKFRLLCEYDGWKLI